MFFERPDPRLIESADPSPLAAVIAALQRQALAAAACVSVIACGYAISVEIGLHAASATRGVLTVAGPYEPVTIVRDRRDVPHISARNEHDLFFAEGFVQGSDRLFQLDLTRRYAYGRLAEVLGAKALTVDRLQRAADIAGIANRQLSGLSPRDRDALSAFSSGINAAATTQPLPVEFRMLLYRPARWTPKDSLAVSIVASLELSDSWHDVFARDAVWKKSEHGCFDALFPLTDPRYDVSVDGRPTADDARDSRRSCLGDDLAGRSAHRPAIGSNAWAAGATHSADGHALLANDPHLDVTIPGIWYVVDIRSPQLHAAGATIPGIPGVVLGHTESLAWSSTNGEMATTSVFEAGRLDPKSWVTERFAVRFSHDVTAAYYRTTREFGVPDENDRSKVALVRWPVYAERASTIATALALDRAHNVAEALRILARYRGSPENFLLADRDGNVAYHVAGLIPNDPAWGRYVHPASDLRENFPPVPFERLPGKNPSRAAVLLSANNKPYAGRYQFRLSAAFDAPYRAYRIAQLLRVRRAYDAAYFARMQLDTVSPIDAQFARELVKFARDHRADAAGARALRILSRWNGGYEPQSRAAALEHAIRDAVFRDAPIRGVAPSDDTLRGALELAGVPRQDWSIAGGMRVEHPLAPMNFAFLNGGWLPGSGDEYTIHLQEPGFAQGFRAVWDAGDWDRGGISIPSGESGEPGSGHYTDLTGAWIAGALQPLPFSRNALARNASATLVLRP
ncbi:MAG: penicillin acylase family protein [Candidatus Eremiobacteraeota bacterium]|nr:penicillin acylase family protein [Candidatus Eremiobacteraeota bacterium]MBV9262952.1 penicillin acylase family protein [Candidatus Eremiobacteraeota bacterium]